MQDQVHGNGGGAAYPQQYVRTTSSQSCNVTARAGSTRDGYITDLPTMFTSIESVAGRLEKTSGLHKTCVRCSRTSSVGATQ